MVSCGRFQSLVRAGLIGLALLIAPAGWGREPIPNAAAKPGDATVDRLAPPSHLIAKDHPDDTGSSIDLTWRRSPDDVPESEPRKVQGYEIRRAAADGAAWELIGRVPYATTEFTDRSCAHGREYLYEVAAVGSGRAPSMPIRLPKPVRATMQWFDTSRGWFAAMLVVVCGVVVLFTELVKSGRNLYVREIPGLKAVDDAVGRATEMGRTCLFVAGTQDMNEISTVAGITVLARVARTAAEYDAAIEVPTSRSLVMTAARETVQGAYAAAGRQDAYNEDRIYYVTDEQFGFVAHLAGIMVRDKPAACFYMGAFFAESLILAETGNSIGAIQVAGTAEPAQLPFFVAACDYTLIGEELFAASAYLSGEPHQLGSLKGQDAGKLLAAALLVAGCGLATLVSLWPEWEPARAALDYLRDTILGKGMAG